MLTLVEYLLWVPNSIARPPARPAGLLASDSGTGPRIEPNHTQALAGLFTAAWQHPCQCLSAWARALAACWGIRCGGSASPDSPPPWSAVCSPAAPAPASNAVRAANGRVKDLGFKLGSCRIFKQSCKVQVQRFYQRDKTKSWSGLKLSSADGDWVVDLEHWLEYQGYNCEIFKQSCKVQRFNQRDKTKSWSFLKLSSADGDGDVDHELRLECCWCYC
jgi:hypothetical protein